MFFFYFFKKHIPNKARRVRVVVQSELARSSVVTVARLAAATDSQRSKRRSAFY
jgi:hypothetical protein